jgi:hypothetical protein
MVWVLCAVRLIILTYVRTTLRAGVAQSVQCLATDWTTGRSGFDPRQSQEIFLLASVSSPLWGLPSLLYNGILGVLFSGLKRCRGVTLTTHPHLVPRS